MVDLLFLLEDDRPTKAAAVFIDGRDVRGGQRQVASITVDISDRSSSRRS